MPSSAELKGGDVKGHIFMPSCNSPLPNGRVVLILGLNRAKEITATSDENGNFYFENIEPNTYSLEIWRDERGFMQTGDDVVVRKGEITTINIDTFGIIEGFNGPDFAAPDLVCLSKP
ncbi:MAG: carboxypeptidase-like regulatory domain-containing protein [Anaerolineales bacterium]|nr:MAG: carboxypeptidase-like regulatory domain-containing protein [Anaerolineales bacterium]